MVTLDHTKTVRTVGALAALAAAATLAGCHEKPYPSPAHETVVRTTTTTTELAGPSYAPPREAYTAPAPYPTVTESYSSTTISGSTPIYTLPPVQPARPYQRGDSSVVYDLGPVVGHSRVHSRLYADQASTPRADRAPRATAVRHPAAHVAAPAPMAVAPHPVAAAKPHPVVPNSRIAAAAAVAMASAADAAHKAAMAAQNAAGKATSTTTTTTKTETSASSTNATGAAGDRTTRLATLQTALTSAVAAKAVLATPDKMTPGQPVDVSLTLPADFADTMRKESEKDGLADAAASVNLTALLAGDGYAVTPAEAQSQPLTVGQPTEFHWTVTAQPNAKGPLHADVGADLLGGGSDTLNLGTVQKGGAFGMKLTPKMLGAGILALIVILVLGWLARGRSPSRSASGRRASRRARGAGSAYNPDRPLDMTSEPADRL